MLKDEFQRLMKLFHEGAEGKPVNLEEVFRSSLEFFEHLKGQIEKGSPEEKKEAMLMMQEMYNQMILETKHISQRSGVSEEQLVAFAENPSNFTPEQWRSIQESKEKIAHAGHELAKVIQNLTKPPSPPSKEEKKPSSGKKTKKSQWMRS